MFGRKRLKAAAPDVEVDAAKAAYQELMAQIMSEAPTCHSLVLAAKFVGYFSSPSDRRDPDQITVDDIDKPVICQANHEGRLIEGLSFTFVGQRGERGVVYLFEEFGDIAPEGNAQRFRVPVSKFESGVRDYRIVLRDVMQKMRPVPAHDVEQAARLQAQLKQFLG
ncbi:hypothetical protein FHS95_001130 [Sphingomonas naasensis]|uniref:Uncharacterized protein n=1 Tax=Sphingomonas naasensis TaxID=1344951 RepID=A0A4S1W8W5_9SPHN|nr:hypothetical protein [Sphingomonas naasensis]NIJ19461.1 hypothetical protein [Sphingomonas naasensis]TGX39198.1 hypothetical protein E5A74_16915 [Sphingomonas naasensis]